ncbi:MAG: hypothetical protein AAGN66_12525 [Acidobacteriota bacterium]
MSQILRFFPPLVVAFLIAVPLAADDRPSPPSLTESLPGSEPMIDRLDVEGTPDPYFVSGEKAFLASGELDEAILGFTDREMLGHALSRPLNEDGCVEVTFLSSTEEPPGTWWEGGVPAAVEESRRVLLGTVTGRAYGFGDGRPGTLLRLDIDEVLKGFHPAGKVGYVFFPVGEFEAGGRKLCPKNPRFGALPELGDRLLLLLRGVHYEGEQLLMGSGLPASMLTLSKGRVSALPKLWREVETDLEGLPEAGLLADVSRMIRETDDEGQGDPRIQFIEG